MVDHVGVVSGHVVRDQKAVSLVLRVSLHRCSLEVIGQAAAQLLLDVVIPEHEVGDVGEGPEDGLLQLGAVEAVGNNGVLALVQWL